MNWLEGTLTTAVAAAIATTFDDNLYLTLFFGKVNRSFRPRHVVIGEYVGFTALVGVSLVGFLGRLVIPEIWIGLLGLLPVLVGSSQLTSRSDDGAEVQMVAGSRASSPDRLRRSWRPEGYRELAERYRPDPYGQLCETRKPVAFLPSRSPMAATISAFIYHRSQAKTSKFEFNQMLYLTLKHRS